MKNKTINYVLIVLTFISINTFAQQNRALQMIQKISETNAIDGNQFASSIAVSGNQMVVGAYAGDSDAESNVLGYGIAYVYELTNGTWQQTAELRADDPSIRSFFGHTVAIEGDRILVSSVYRNKLYVFEKISGVWTLSYSTQYGPLAFFGYSMQLSGDFAYISSPRREINGKKNAGRVYVFERITSSSWVERARIEMSTALEGAFFGNKILFKNGLLYIAAYGRNSLEGKIYIYENQAGNWTNTAEISANDSSSGDWFGADFVIDGNRMLVSSFMASQSNPAVINSGAVYLFELTNSVWVQTQKFEANDAMNSDYFGKSIALFGNQVLIGVPNDDDNGINTGSVYIYEKTGGNWSLSSKQYPDDINSGAAYGSTLLTDNWNVYIGAPNNNALYYY